MDFFERIKRERKEDQDRRIIEFLNRRNMYQRTFGTETGRQVLLDQLKVSHFFETSFTGNSTGMYQEGERGKILDIMMHCPLIAGEVIYYYCKELEENYEKAANDYKRELGEK